MLKKSNLDITLIILMIFLFQFRPAAQETDFNIRNFPKNDYRAASQNWGVSPGHNGFMYFANHKGLLEFDGVTWELHTMPNDVTTRAVYANDDSIIYTSGYREMGFWKREQSGILTYHSLNPLVQNFFTKNEEFWNIASLDGKVYFQSFNRVIIYQEGKAAAVDVPGFVSSMNKVRDQVLIAVNNQGLFSIENGQVRPFLTDPFFMNKVIRFILPYRHDQIMIGTAYNGITIWDGKNLREWNPGWTAFLKENELNRAYLAPQGHLVLGTILGGVLIFDRRDNLLARFDVSNGLQNNTVLGINIDRFGNIWLALDRGIDLITSRPNDGLTREAVPDVGAVYSAAVFENKIYLGTNQGLFFRTVSAEKGGYELVPGTQGQIWDCSVVGKNLLVSHNRGTILVRDGGASFISKNSGGFSVRKDTQSELLIQSTYSNLVAFRKQGDRYAFYHAIDGFSDLIRYLEIDHLGNIWASHMHRGIYQLKLDEKRENVVRQKYYGVNSIFQKDHGIHVFKVENRIIFTTGEKLYTPDDLNDAVIPYDELNEKLGVYSRSHRILEAPGHRYWFINTDSFALFYIFGERAELIRSYPMSVFADSPLIDEFENICPVSEEKAILCLEDGIAWINVSVSDSGKLISRFPPRLRSVHLVNRRNERVTGFPRNNRLKIGYTHNNIRLRYAFPYYTHEPVYYQARIRGLQEEWSEKSEKPIYHFDRLPAGTYELQVKAADLWNNESQVSHLTLEVSPPWYQSLPARIIWFVVLILVLIFFRNWGVRQTRRKEKEEHEKQEQELIRLRNENLNAEIMHKSNELASSTMSIIRKNEFLLELKRTMINQKEQLGSRYPDKYFHHIVDRIDKNIDSNDDWLVFSTNFEKTHEAFLKKMKDDFPELTAKDLRICAYLRMNLSSKEIAPLMGISVRGVENHRYRLRKKMGLDPDANLIDLILKY